MTRLYVLGALVALAVSASGCIGTFNGVEYECLITSFQGTTAIPTCTPVGHSGQSR